MNLADNSQENKKGEKVEKKFRYDIWAKIRKYKDILFQGFRKVIFLKVK